MTLSELLVSMNRVMGKISLDADGNSFTVDAPRGAINDTVKAALRVHKSTLLLILTSDDPSMTLLWQLTLDRLADQRALPEEVLAEYRLATARWVPYVDDCDSEVVINPDDVPICPNCNQYADWQNPLGEWRCNKCQPPVEPSKRWRRLREQCDKTI